MLYLTWFKRILNGTKLVLLCSVAMPLTQLHADQGLHQPEAASGFHVKPSWIGKNRAVAAAHPLATEAGYQILKQGGSAIDAAVAVQMVLTLVEPQSSGIGGGAFLMHVDGASVQAYDGREVAPAAAHEGLFLNADGKPMKFGDAVVGGRAVGVPGVVAMLEMAHKAHGKLPWAALMAPAIRLADQGFPVGARLHKLLDIDPYLRRDPAAASYFYDGDGKPWPQGHVLKNPALAEVFRVIAKEGARALYTGALAQSMVDKVRNHPSNPGLLSMADLASYRPKQREPLCFRTSLATERTYRICGFPPPGSGAIAIGQILGILEQTPAARLPIQPANEPRSVWLHYYTQAANLAFADRAQYIADPDFTEPAAGGWMGLLNPQYLARRAQQIGETDAGVVGAGTPVTEGHSSLTRLKYANMNDQEEYGTSHVSIVDGKGRAVSMTTTIEDAFGARQMVNGFLLNNQLTDFSFLPRDAQGRPVANRVEPFKRPRSSMSPTLVFDDQTGQLHLVLGSPGGAMIIHYTAKALWSVLHWKLDLPQALGLPNWAANNNGLTVLETARFSGTVVDGLRARGHQIREFELTSGTQAIQRVPGGLRGAADPRREGRVMGD